MSFQLIEHSLFFFLFFVFLLTLLPRRVPDGIRSPSHTRVAGADGAQERAAPVAHVGGLPDDNGMGTVGSIVVADVPTAGVDPEIGSDDPGLAAAVLAANDAGVAHAGGAHIGDENGAAAVYPSPGARVVVVGDGQVDLLTIIGALAGELWGVY